MVIYLLDLLANFEQKSCYDCLPRGLTRNGFTNEIYESHDFKLDL